MLKRRIVKELRAMTVEPPIFAAAGPVGDDLFNWQAALQGPEGSPYEGGVFFLSIYFPANFPYEPPKISFNTRVYHPNIDSSGRIRMCELMGEWTQAYTIGKVLVLIHNLLMEPNVDNALVPVIAHRYKYDIERYKEIARDFTHKYAV